MNFTTALTLLLALYILVIGTLGTTALRALEPLQADYAALKANVTATRTATSALTPKAPHTHGLKPYQPASADNDRQRPSPWTF